VPEVGLGIVVVLELEVKLPVEVPKFCVDVCPHPVAAEKASAITAAAARPRREGDSREFKFKLK